MKIFHVYANRINMGDLLSALAIKKLSKVDYHDILWTNGQYRKTIRIIQNLNPEDSIVIGGGGLLKDTFLPLWELILNNYKGNKIILWGVGECINKNVENTGLPDNIISSIANIATKIFVRDFSTKDRFLRLGTVAEVIGCPSTSIARSWKKRSDKYLLHVIHPELLKGTLEYWRKSVRKLANDLDLQYAEIDHIISTPLLTSKQKLFFTRKYYENASLIVSSRLHGIILGSAQGVPVIPISNDFKIESYWKGTLGGEKVLSINDYDLLRGFVKAEEYDSPEVILNAVNKIVELNHQASLEVAKILEY